MERQSDAELFFQWATEALYAIAEDYHRVSENRSFSRWIGGRS
jgi:hypothetical protein